MKSSIESTDETRLEVGQILNLLLAYEYVLYATARDYHWNLTDSEFPDLHQQFEQQYEQSAQWIGDVAERVHLIGAGARGDWSDLAKAAPSSADPGTGLSARHMLSELLALHEELIVQLRTDSDACARRFNDAGTADFLTSLMKQHEKAAGKLQSQLESGEEATSPCQPLEMQPTTS